MRAVLDTNTVLSALLFPHGRLGWISAHWSVGRFVPLVSRATTQELIRAVAYPKFDLDEDEIELLLSSYLPYAELVLVSPTPPRTLPRCRDADDQKFLILAACGHAEVLVTGERALLEVRARVPFAIERPAEFKSRFLA